ncbi:hypothetical protein ACK8OR_14365 [Jannaschia sp. KMU-145]|uniref:hypothetical protein n=1 Tax=Jannaschia halovivens TaxID=3388667 RepID=UPI00396B0D18
MGLQMNIGGGLVLAVVLAGCAPPQVAPRIVAEPVFNKMGAVVGCTDGRDPTPVAGTTTVPVNPCLPPEECEPGTTATAATLPCTPLPSRGDDRDSGTPADGGGTPGRGRP